MTDLSKERLEKIASWRETYGADSNVMIPAAEAEAIVREVLQRREAAEKPVAEVNLVENEDRPWLDPKISIHLIDNLASCHLKDKDKLFASTPLTSAERERLAELEAKFARLPADWEKDSSLETWFPLTAERLAAYDRAAKEPVGYLCEWSNGHNVVYFDEPGSASFDDWNEIPTVHHNTPVFTAPPLPVVPDELKTLSDSILLRLRTKGISGREMEKLDYAWALVETARTERENLSRSRGDHHG